MPAKKATQFNFEDSLKQLDQLINQLEKGELPLEKSLACFEEGIKHIRNCQQALKTAEQKVQILTQEGTKNFEALDDATPTES